MRSSWRIGCKGGFHRLGIFGEIIKRGLRGGLFFAGGSGARAEQVALGVVHDDVYQPIWPAVEPRIAQHDLGADAFEAGQLRVKLFHQRLGRDIHRDLLRLQNEQASRGQDSCVKWFSSAEGIAVMRAFFSRMEPICIDPSRLDDQGYVRAEVLA